MVSNAPLLRMAVSRGLQLSLEDLGEETDGEEGGRREEGESVTSEAREVGSGEGQSSGKAGVSESTPDAAVGEHTF